MIKRYVLKTIKPNKLWKTIRFVLHWISLPLKVSKNLILGVFTRIVALSSKKRTISSVNYKQLDLRQQYFNSLLKKLPVLKGSGLKVYAPRVPLDKPTNGSTHVSQNQTKLQALLVFLSSELGIHDEQLVNGLTNSFLGGFLTNGFTVNSENKAVNNIQSADDLLLSSVSLAIATLNVKKMSSNVEIDGEKYVPLSGVEFVLREKYEILILKIFEDYDMSFLEGATPEDETAKKLFKELIKQSEGDVNLIMMKSHLGMFQPGLELSSKNALAILAALKVTGVKLRSIAARKYYNKLLWKYGYGILGAFTNPKEKNLSEMLSLYTLSLLSTNFLGKLYWRLAMKWTWGHTKHKYNALFTGLLNKSHEKAVSQKYLDTCRANLYEEEPRNYGFNTVGSVVANKTKEYPVKYNNSFESEFMESQDLVVNLDIVDERVKTGLGWLLQALVLEEDPKKLLKD